MSVILLSIISVVLVLTALIGAVNFPLVPAFFGVYGQSRHEQRGRTLVKLLWLFPILTVICLVVAWGASSTVISYIAFFPLIYLMFLWSLRANKQDGSGTEKRFSVVKENVDEQIRELEYKWASWEEIFRNNSIMCFEAWLPNEAQAFELQETLSKKVQLIGIVDSEKEDDKTVVMRFSIPIDTINKPEVIGKINNMIDLIWQSGGELCSTEIETP